MDQSTPTASPLRRRVTEDMPMRNFKPKTQAAHLQGVTKLATCLKRSPRTATADELRRGSNCTGSTTGRRLSRSTPRSAA